MWATSSVNIVSPFPIRLPRRTYSLEVLAFLPGRPQQLLHPWRMCLPSRVEGSHLQVTAKSFPSPRDGSRRMRASGVSHSTFPHTSILWSKQGTWSGHDSPNPFVVEYLRSLFLSYLIRITQKYGSQISSIWFTWELVRNVEAYAPLQNYWIHLSLLTSCKYDYRMKQNRLW